MKKLAVVLIALGGILSGCIFPGPGTDGGGHRGDRDHDGASDHRDGDRDGDGVSDRRDSRPNDSRRN